MQDDKHIAEPLLEGLASAGYKTTRATTGALAVERVQAAPPAVMLLSSDLPDVDGVELCASLRAAGYAGGIILLAARATELDCVVGLDAGADDYVVTSVALAELQARVRAVLRRQSRGVSEPARLNFHGVRLDTDTRRTHYNGNEISLTAKEFDVLAVLMHNHGDVVPRAELMKLVWDRKPTGSTKTLDVTIGRLRRKLRAAGVADKITNVRGVGFRFNG